MSTVIWGVSPHPPLLVPEVGGESVERVRSTQEALRAFCREVASRNPERLVLITPHGPVHPRAMILLMGERLGGSLARFGHPEVRVEVAVDEALSLELAAAARARGLEVLPLTREEARRNDVILELDHALLVPLYYLREAGVDVPVVAISVSRLPGEPHVKFGEALREVLSRARHRAAVVASGDLSHRLLESGPYGFDEMGPVFDQQMLRGLEAADLPSLLHLPEDLVDRAGQCGLRPILTLMGSLEKGARGRVRSYEGPFGVGYAVVQFDPAPPSPHVALARQAVEEFVLRGRRLDPPPEVPQDLQGPAPAFVTLKRRGNLRGCIGTLGATCSTLYEEIVQNAIGACSRDPRFPPVGADEVRDLEYQVYVLGPAEPVNGLEHLDPSRYGVIVRKTGRSGVLLPGLEGIDSAEHQVAIACRKAGIMPQEGPDLERFEVCVYREETPSSG